MSQRKSSSLGAALAARLQNAITKSERILRPGARDLPVLVGLRPNGVGLRPYENLLAEAAQILIRSKCVWLYGNSIVTEIGSGVEKQLVPLATNGDAEKSARSRLANLFVCSNGDHRREQQFAPPTSFVSTLLARKPTIEALPRIRLYARRPVFDDNFVICGPGYHSQSKILVHGIDVEPTLPDVKRFNEAEILERLSPHLRQLLAGFCFKTPADAANAVAAMLTGVLVTHFVGPGKPIFVLDGNQPGVGKTLLARVIAIVLDGLDAKLIHFTHSEEELQKRILATIRNGRQSVLLIDNAKCPSGSVISSSTIEANSMAPTIALRILGVSENYVRPNDVVWCLTMNNTKLSPDLVSRAVPIRFHYEGRPEDRDFSGQDPLQYALCHRAEILGELAGMVVRWNQEGRPEGNASHRLTHWAKIIGGVLLANGLGEGLSNHQEAAAEFNTALDDFAAIAEAAIKLRRKDLFHVAGEAEEDCGRPAAEWAEVYQKAQVGTDRLEQIKSQRGKATAIGNLLSTFVGRTVQIEVEGRCGVAELRMEMGHARMKRYFLEVTWDRPDDTDAVRAPGSSVQPRPVSRPARKIVAARPVDETVDHERPHARIAARKNSEQW